MEQENQVDNAIELFNKIIKVESHISRAPHYYTACALLKTNSNNEMKSSRNFVNLLSSAHYSKMHEGSEEGSFFLRYMCINRTFYEIGFKLHIQ